MSRHPVAALAVGVAFGVLWDLVLHRAFLATGLAEGIRSPLMLFLVVLILILPTIGLELLLLWPALRPRFLLPFVVVALVFGRRWNAGTGPRWQQLPPPPAGPATECGVRWF